MSDYIKREDALQDIDNAHANTITQRGYKDYWSADLETQLVCDGLAKAIEAIFDTPSADVVEVVRCKDCIYWCKLKEDNGVVVRIHHNELRSQCLNIKGLNKTDCITEANDYCSYGEMADT